MTITASSRITAIVPAAGIGSRMKQSVPKQYLTINHITVLEHTVTALLAHPKIDHVVIALQANDPYFPTLPIAHHPQITVVEGGKTRAESVMAGLAILDENQHAHWALVHDAARPCIQLTDIDNVITVAMNTPSGAILAQPITDTIKLANLATSAATIDKTIPRENLWRALTPQCFSVELLKCCLQRALQDGAEITDEASALEYCGYSPLLINGRSDNIKITWPEDLALAQFYLNHYKNKE